MVKWIEGSRADSYQNFIVARGRRTAGRMVLSLFRKNKGFVAGPFLAGLSPLVFFLLFPGLFASYEHLRISP